MKIVTVTVTVTDALPHYFVLRDDTGWSELVADRNRVVSPINSGVFANTNVSIRISGSSAEAYGIGKSNDIMLD